jgi:hypothetical protein
MQEANTPTIIDGALRYATTHTSSMKEYDRCVGWVEQSETQRLQDFRVLGFVPQPNLHL